MHNCSNEYWSHKGGKGRWYIKHRVRSARRLGHSSHKVNLDSNVCGHYSDLNLAPPPPPRMMAFMKSKKRLPYSTGGTGLILCYTTWSAATKIYNKRLNVLTRSADNPFHRCSNRFTTVYGVRMSMTPR